ncbi:hypothetical protein [Thermoflexus sp.]|nr:hypothetical protein [Thermoflexus sp.]
MARAAKALGILLLILAALALLAMACAFGVEAFAEFMAGFEKILVRLMR